MIYFEKGRVAEIAESIVTEHQNSTALLSDVEKSLWVMAHMFIASTITTALDDSNCRDELKAFSKLSKDELLDVYKILAFWFFYEHEALDKRGVQNVLNIVYKLSDSDIQEMKDELADRDLSFKSLHTLMSQALDYDISYLLFMPHVVTAYKLVNAMNR